MSKMYLGVDDEIEDRFED